MFFYLNFYFCKSTLIVSVNLSKYSIKLIILFGLISLFGDMIYESAKSINGQYLLLLGATASVIGFYYGLAEFVSNFFRFVFGFAVDKTKNYWFFVILGYFLLIFVPLMALTKSWQIAILFIVFERLGKAIRNPARDTLVSFMARKSKNIGLSFGLIELFDQVGALLGPLLIASIFIFLKGTEIEKYQTAYFVLFIPFVLLLLILFSAYSNSKNIRIEEKTKKRKEKISKKFYIYILFTFFTTLGFINFAILGYHLKINSIFPDHLIIILYSLAMISDAIIAPFIGKAYDEFREKFGSGFILLTLMPLLNILIPILIFSSLKYFIIFAMVFYGIFLSTQETIMRAAIADITPISKRGFSYGIFSFVFGISLFLSSSIIGFLYEVSIKNLIIFIVASQIVSLLFLFLINKRNL